MAERSVGANLRGPWEAVVANTRRSRLSSLGSNQGMTVPEAMERLEAIDQTLAEAHEQARPQIMSYESRYRELCDIIHKARAARIDWQTWAFSTLGFRPREGGYFSASDTGNIVDNLEHAVWALRRTDTEKWKWFGVALHGATYGMMVELLRKVGSEVVRPHGQGQKEFISFEDALRLLCQPGLLPGNLTPWLSPTPAEAPLQEKALLELVDSYRHCFIHILPTLARPFRIVDFIDQVALRVLRSLTVLALEYYTHWTPEQRLRIQASVSRINDLLLLEYGRLQGELMQLLCRAHYAGVPLQSRKRG
jgi:hypothetical protein